MKRTSNSKIGLENLESRLLMAAAPTLTSVAPISSALANVEFDITFDKLKLAANEKDVDGDPITFKVTGVTAGTLKLNDGVIGAFPVEVGIGDVLNWTPALSAKGVVSAFTIKAFDGAMESAADVAVKVNTKPAAKITVTATKPLASELTDGVTKGVGAFTFTRAGGDLTQSLDVTYTIDTGAAGHADAGNDYTALTGTVHFDAGKTTAVVKVLPTDDLLFEGIETVTVVLDAGANYLLGTKTSALVKISDYELSPLGVDGGTFAATIKSGGGPFATKGKFTLVFATNGTDYAIVGTGAVPTSQGTFTYLKTSSTAAELTFDDSELGNFTGTLTFKTTKTATFDFTDGANHQKGSGTFGISQAFAPADIGGRTLSGKLANGATFVTALSGSSDSFATMSTNYTVVAGAALPAGEVIAGPVKNPANGHLYYVLKASYWTAAEANAVKLGGHLATVNDEVENEWILTTFELTNPGKQFWIGYYDPIANDGTGAQHAANFRWSSGQTPGYAPWAVGEPNNWNAGELMYTQLIRDNNGLLLRGTWNDTPDDGTTHLGLGVVELGLAVTKSSYGAYTYQQLANNLALLTMANDAAIEVNTTSMLVLFTSSKAATFIMDDTLGLSTRGTLTMGSVASVNVTPASLNGKVIGGVASSGLPPFKTNGVYSMAMGVGTYVATNGPASASSTGTYTFEKFSGNLGVIVFDDSVAGICVELVTFSTATKGTYVLSDLLGVGQKGSLTLA